MLEYFKIFERAIVVCLLLMMAIVLLLTTLELGWTIMKSVLYTPLFFMEISHLMEIFGDFLLILIGLELLETTKLFLTDKMIHVEVVILVAIMAIARKIIILDVKKLPSLTLIGIALIIISLIGGYYLLKKIPMPTQEEKSATDI